LDKPELGEAEEVPLLAKVTLLSNGHGEDAVGVLLGTEIRRLRPDIHVSTYPTVGVGSVYEDAGFDVLGPRRAMPSGGLTLHSATTLMRDLRAGFVGLTMRQWGDLVRLETDLLLVVGDIYAQLQSALVRTNTRFVYQTLVSASHGYGRPKGGVRRLFMEVFTPLERMLMRRLADRVYVRDAATETLLKGLGVPNVSFLGNPILDAATGHPITSLSEKGFPVVLVPGSRRYAGAALGVMLESLLQARGFTGAVAWLGGNLPHYPGWRLEAGNWEQGVKGVLRREGQEVWVFEGRFDDLLAGAHLVLGTAGTAHEQAAGLGIPIVSFPLPPDYTEAFLANQRRLLGPALTISSADPNEIARNLVYFMSSKMARHTAAQAGRSRMGPPGGSRAIVRDLLARAVSRGVLPKEVG
jgi:uncharacterized protein (TIGR03492 family)